MKTQNIVDLLIENNFIYLVLVNLISSDTLVGLDSCKESSRRLAKLEKDLETSKLKDDKLVSQFKRCREIVEKEINNYLSEDK